MFCHVTSSHPVLLIVDRSSFSSHMVNFPCSTARICLESIPLLYSTMQYMSFSLLYNSENVCTAPIFCKDQTNSSFNLHPLSDGTQEPLHQSHGSMFWIAISYSIDSALSMNNIPAWCRMLSDTMQYQQLLLDVWL